MLLSGKFRNVVAQANKALSKFTGQLFSYNAKINHFQMVKTQGLINAFQKQWIFLIFVAVIMFLRIIDYKVSVSSDGNQNTSTKLNFITLMLGITFTISVHFRVRGFCPNNYLSFLNNALYIERKHDDGTSRT